jgi:Cu+-exporting ATPase
MAGTGKAAEMGILFKSAEAMETASHISTVVFDKTGTLTTGQLVVADVLPVDGHNPQELVQLAASLEKQSDHPLAQALTSSVEEKVMPVTSFEMVPGRGVKGCIEGRLYWVGNAAFIEERVGSIKSEYWDHWLMKAQRLAAEGKTPLFIASDTDVLGIIALADRLRPEARETIKALKDRGMKVIMLTGDQETTARLLAHELSVDEVIAGVLPDEKERIISELQQTGQIVAMVGDGINDAPALARADVGVTIGAGTDVALDIADVVLIHDRLMSLVQAFQWSRSVLKNIKQNLFWAFFYNVLGIPLAAGLFYILFGWRLTPVYAAAAMSLSSLTVVSNALRLTRFQPREKN